VDSVPLRLRWRHQEEGAHGQGARAGIWQLCKQVVTRQVAIPEVQQQKVPSSQS